MTSATEYSVQANVLSSGDGRMVLSPLGTTYELHLKAADAASPLPAGGTRCRGTITVKARKVWTVSAGGGFVTPITGEPRVIQGRVKLAEPGRLIVQAGPQFTVQLPEDPLCYDLVAGPLAVGAMVNITLYPGASFQPVGEPA